MSINLEYNYAVLDSNYCCGACFTSTRYIDHPSYIVIPYTSDDYIDKYYNATTDLWYEDAEMTIEATEINEMYHG